MAQLSESSILNSSFFMHGTAAFLYLKRRRLIVEGFL
jgi:hypothetical protein